METQDNDLRREIMNMFKDFKMWTYASVETMKTQVNTEDDSKYESKIYTKEKIYPWEKQSALEEKSNL